MSEVQYQELAAEFNEKMGLAEPDDDVWEDALIRWSVIAEEAGELVEAVNKGRYDDIPEELADIVITCYTGADTLDLEIPEEFDVELGTSEFEDREREEVGEIFQRAALTYNAVSMRNRRSVETQMRNTVACCHRAAELFDVDLAAEYEEKMEYNMQKSGAKVNGKPVDDVEDDDDEGTGSDS